MAKKIVEKPEFILNAREPALGVGILQKKRDGISTYAFTRGGVRSFKDEYVRLYIKEAVVVSQIDRDKLKPPPPRASAVPRATNKKLEREIIANRDDPDTRAVYADFLLQKQDPRGELMAVQQRLAVTPNDKAMCAREAKLLADHLTYFVPRSLAAALKIPRRGGPRTEVVWRAGFFDTLVIAKDTTPSWNGIDLVTIVREGLSHPSAKFLRRLVLGSPGGHPWSYLPHLAQIALTEHEALEELVIGEVAQAKMETAWAHAGDLGPTLAAAPRLKKLAAKAGTLRFGKKKLAHATLEEIHVETRDLVGRDLEMIFGGELPKLHTLDLSAEKIHVTKAAATKFALGLPKLRHLTLRGTLNTRLLVEAILEAPRLAQLETLVLDRNDLDVVGASRVIADHAKLAHIKTLDLRSPALPAELRGMLSESLPGAAVAQPRFAITESQIVRRSRHRETTLRARKMADPKQWRSLGYDARLDRVFGEFEGSSRYSVWASFGERPEGGCDCPSPHNPCKHELALMLIAATQYDFPVRGEAQPKVAAVIDYEQLRAFDAT